MLRIKAKIDETNKDGDTALSLALQYRCTNAAKILLENKANPNLGNNKKQTPLMFASYQGYNSTVEILINNGADAKVKDNQGKMAKYFALLNGHKKVAKILRAENKKIEEFWKAVHSRNLQSIQNLVDKNKFLINEIDSFGNNALLLALCYRDVKKVKWLLEQKIHLNVSNGEGDTPLFAAIRYVLTVILSFQVEMPETIFETGKKAENILDSVVTRFMIY